MVKVGRTKILQSSSNIDSAILKKPQNGGDTERNNINHDGISNSELNSNGTNKTNVLGDNRNANSTNTKNYLTDDQKKEMKEKFYEMFRFSEHCNSKDKLLRYITKKKYEDFVDAIKFAKTDDGYKNAPNVKHQLNKYTIKRIGGREVFGKEWIKNGREMGFRYDVSYQDLFDELFNADVANNHIKRGLVHTIQTRYKNINARVVRWYCSNICPICMSNCYEITKQKKKGSDETGKQTSKDVNGNRVIKNGCNIREFRENYSIWREFEEEGKLEGYKSNDESSSEELETNKE